MSNFWGAYQKTGKLLLFFLLSEHYKFAENVVQNYHDDRNDHFRNETSVRQRRINEPAVPQCVREYPSVAEERECYTGVDEKSGHKYFKQSRKSSRSVEGKKFRNEYSCRFFFAFEDYEFVRDKSEQNSQELRDGVCGCHRGVFRKETVEYQIVEKKIYYPVDESRRNSENQIKNYLF